MTAFEGKCRIIIELRKHLKRCFVVILQSEYWKKVWYPSLCIALSSTFMKFKESRNMIVGKSSVKSVCTWQKMNLICPKPAI